MAKTALVTGSSRGIGRALCNELHSRGWQVIATCRNPDSIKDEPFYKKLPLAVDDDESIRNLVAELKGEHIDLLINNAGQYTPDQSIMDLDRQAMLHEFNIDSVSPMMVTKALLPNLQAVKGSVIMVSSLMGSIGDAQAPRSYAYRAAKAALNMYTKVLALEMKEKLEWVVAIHPGMVATDMIGGGRPGAISAEEAAKAMIDTFEGMDESRNGGFLSRLGKIDPY